MAKKSAIVKYERRKALVVKYAAHYARLKAAAADPTLSEEER